MSFRCLPYPCVRNLIYSSPNGRSSPHLSILPLHTQKVTTWVRIVLRMRIYNFLRTERSCDVACLVRTWSVVLFPSLSVDHELLSRQQAEEGIPEAGSAARICPGSRQRVSGTKNSSLFYLTPTLSPHHRATGFTTRSDIGPAREAGDIS